MTDKQEFIECKKYERFKVKSGAIAMIRPLQALEGKNKNISLDGNSLDATIQYCQIKCIDKGGLVLSYIEKNGNSNEPVELDLLFIQDSICFTYLKNVPIKTVWVSQVPGNNSSDHITTIQRDVRFGDMTLHQKSQLDRFIKKYKIM